MICNFCKSVHKNTVSDYRFINKDSDLYTYNSICQTCEERFFQLMGELKAPQKTIHNIEYKQCPKCTSKLISKSISYNKYWCSHCHHAW